MRRSLPKSELEFLYRWYDDYAINVLGWKRVEEEEEDFDGEIVIVPHSD